MKSLNEKWEKVVESNKYATVSDQLKGDLSLVLENTEAEGKQISERTESGDIAAFTPILVPLVRRVYPTLIANNLVGMQALKTPTAYIYALVYKYGNTSDNPVGMSESAQILSLDSAVAVGDTLVGDVSGAEGEVVYVESEGKTALVKITNGTLFQAEATNTNTNEVLATWTNEAQFQKVLNDYSGQYSTSVGEDLTTDMKEVGFDIQRTMVEAKTRKLKGKYTLEMFQDLKAMHGIDAEKEIMNLMQLELSWETDRQVVNYVNDLASAASDVTVSAYDGRWEIEKYRSLGIKIGNEGRKIGQAIKRGSANTMLVSPKVAVALEAIGSFQIATTDSTVNAVNSGVNPNAGVFDKRFKTIVDNFNDGANEYANVLYKGDSPKDSMAFLCPYVGASFIKTQDPDSGQPAVILSSRYGLTSNPLTPEKYAGKFDVNFGSTALA